MSDCEHKNTDEPLCTRCMGSGEGMHPGTICSQCNGSGEYGLICEDCGDRVEE